MNCQSIPKSRLQQSPPWGIHLSCSCQGCIDSRHLSSPYYCSYLLESQGTHCCKYLQIKKITSIITITNKIIEQVYACTHHCDRPVWPACSSAGYLKCPARVTSVNLAAGTFSTEDCWTLFLDCEPCIQVENLQYCVPIYHRKSCGVKSFYKEVTNFKIKSHFLICVLINTIESLTQRSQFIHQNLCFKINLLMIMLNSILRCLQCLLNRSSVVHRLG